MEGLPKKITAVVVFSIVISLFAIVSYSAPIHSSYVFVGSESKIAVGEEVNFSGVVDANEKIGWAALHYNFSQNSDVNTTIEVSDSKDFGTVVDSTNFIVSGPGKKPLTGENSLEETQYSKFYLKSLQDWNLTEIWIASYEDYIPPKYKWPEDKVLPTPGVSYSPTQEYQFRINWTDSTTYIDEVILELDGKNYSYSSGEVKKNGNRYYKNFTLSAGSHTYAWYANDSAIVDNWNSTSEKTYSVDKAVTSTTLLINGSNSESDAYEFNYSDVANFTVSTNVSGLLDKTVYLDTNMSGWSTYSEYTPLERITSIDDGFLNKERGYFNVTGWFPKDKNYTASSDSDIIKVRGRANLTEISLPSLYDGDKVNRSSDTEIICRVQDADTSKGVEDYPVEFWRGSIRLGSNTTNENGYAMFHWNSVPVEEGHHTLKCNISDNSSLSYNAKVDNKTRDIELWRKLSLSLYLDPGVIYRNDTAAVADGKPYESLIIAHVEDENGNVEDGVPVEFWREDLLLGSGSTVSGNATLSHNPVNSISVSNYTMRANTSAEYSWLSQDQKNQTVKGFLRPMIESPQEGENFFKNSTLTLSSTTEDENSNPRQVNSVWTLVETGELLSQMEDGNWKVPVDHEHGNFTLKLDVSKQYFDSNKENITIEINQGFANITELVPQDKIFNIGDIIPVKCRVRDTNTSLMLENYPVNFYKNGSFQVTNITNYTGYATWNWNTTLEDPGSYPVKCNITDNSTLNYTANINEMQTNIDLEKGLEIDKIIREHTEIYRKDDPSTSKITVHVVEAALGPSESSTVRFYNSTAEFASCITNSSGYCNVTYNPSQVTPDNYTIHINATKNGFSPSETREAWTVVKGKLYISIESPNAGAIDYKTKKIWLNSTVEDEYGNEVIANVKWYNPTNLIAEGGNVRWQIPAEHERGKESIKVNATKEYYDSSLEPSVSIYIYGYSNTSWSSPPNGSEIQVGSVHKIVCQVLDANTSDGVEDYPVEFWKNSTKFGENKTNSTGHAIWKWDSSGESPVWYNWKCNITDNDTLFYVESFGESEARIKLGDVTPPAIKEYGFDKEPPAPEIKSEYSSGDNVTILANVTDDIKVDKVWSEIELPNGTNIKAYMTNTTSKHYTVNYTPSKSGTYSVTVFANDTPEGNVNFTYVGSFRAYNSTEIKLSQKQKIIVSDVSQSNEHNFTLNLNATNTGNTTTYNPQFIINYESPIKSRSDIKQGEDLREGKSDNNTFDMQVPNGTEPGNYNIEGVYKWTQPSGTVTFKTNDTTAEILANPILNISGDELEERGEFYEQINHSEKSGVGILNISSTGNFKLDKVVINRTGGEFKDWIYFGKNSISEIMEGNLKTVEINAQVPVGTQPGNYTTKFISNASNSTCLPDENCYKYFNITIQVPSSWYWTMEPGLKESKVNTSGKSKPLFNITVENLGNRDIIFNLSKHGDKTSLIETDPQPEESFLIPGNSTRKIGINSTIPKNQENDLYIINVSLTNKTYASPSQRNTTIKLLVEDSLKPNITYNKTSKSTLEAYESLNITANVTDNIEVDSVWAEIESIQYTDTKELLHIKGDTYRGTYTPTKAGEHTVTIHANDTHPNTESQAAGSFYVLGGTTGNFKTLPIEGSTVTAPNVTKSSPYQFDITANLTNTGNGTMGKSNISLYGSSGLEISPANRTYRCGEIEEGENCLKVFDINVTIEANTGFSEITVNASWYNPDLSLNFSTSNIELNVKSNPFLNIPEGEVEGQVIEGEETDVGSFSIVSSGNTQLSDVSCTESGGNMPFANISRIYHPSKSYDFIQKGVERDVTLNASVDAGFEPGSYWSTVTCNATDSECSVNERCWDNFTLNVTVPKTITWSRKPARMPESGDLSIATESEGSFNINYSNTGNSKVILSVTQSGNGTELITSPPPEDKLSIPLSKQRNNSTAFNYNSEGLSGYYLLKITISNSSATPDEKKTYVHMYVEDLPPKFKYRNVTPKYVDMNYETVTAEANITDNLEINKTWIEIKNETGDKIFSHYKDIGLSWDRISQTYRPKQKGIHFVNISANDTAKGLVNSILMNFTAVGSTKINVKHETQSNLVFDGVTERNGASRDMNITLENIGLGGAYWANVTMETPQNVESEKSLLRYNNITEGNTKKNKTTINIRPGTGPGNYTVDMTGRWTNPNNKLDENTTSFDINVTSNPVLTIENASTSMMVEHGTSETKSFVINSTGNDALNNIVVDCEGGNCSDFDIGFSPSSINLLSSGKHRHLNISASAPLGYDPGTYPFNVNVTHDDGSKAMDLIIEVPPSKNWTISPRRLNKTVGTSQSGILGEINVANLGNINLTLDLGSRGNGSEYIGTKNKLILVEKTSEKEIPVNYTAPEQEDMNNTIETYSTNITIKNSTYGQERNVSAFLRVTRFVVDIILPNQTSPIEEVEAGGSLTIYANTTWIGGVIGENVSFSARLNGTSCINVHENFNTSGDSLWEINCTAPDIADARNYTIEVIGNYRHPSIENIRGADEEVNVVYYKDVRGPEFRGVDAQRVRPGNNTTIEVNVTDNVGVEQVKVRINYTMNDTMEEYNLTHVSGNIWKLKFNDTEKVGDYDLNISAVDYEGNWNHTEGWFEVYTPIRFRGREKNVEKFSFYRPKKDLKIVDVETNESGEYNKTISNRTYDIDIEATEHRHKIKIRNVPVTEDKRNPVSVENIAPSSIGSGVERAVAVETNLSFETASVGMNYSGTGYSNENSLGVYRCDDWNIENETCSGSWERKTTNLNKTSGYASAEVPGFSAFVVGQYICGDGVCDSDYGESNAICPQDCEDGGDGDDGGDDSGDTGGGTTGGGEVGEQQEQEIPPFTMETDLIEATLHPGESKMYSVWVTNNKDTEKAAKIEVVGNAWKFIKIKDKEFTIPAGGTKTVKVEVSALPTTQPGIYTGDLIVRLGGSQRTVPVTVSVTPEKKALMDVKVEAITKSVTKNGTLKYHVSLFNLGFKKRFDAHLTYKIKSSETEKALDQKEEERAIETSTSFVKTYDLSQIDDLERGKYFIEAFVEYDNRTASSVDTFEVTKPFWTRRRKLILVIAISAAIGGAAAWYGWNRYQKWKAAKRRYLLPLDEKSLPRGDIWIGEVAETGKKAELPMDDLTTHILTAGATGSGKTVSAMTVVENLLDKNIPVIVFDPTAQWTGFVRPCRDEDMLSNYNEFGMRKEEAKPFKGMIHEITDPKADIDFERYMKPGQITVFTLDKLTTKQFDTAVRNIIDEVFNQGWEESSEMELCIVFDEVHRLLEKYGGKGAYTALERGAREFRKWGIGLIMISQVLADFKESIKGNVMTEFQLHTKGLADIDRIEKKYGKQYAEQVTREEVGIGMIQNPDYNKGRPWFVHFRPLLHSPHKLPKEELEKYKEYSSRYRELEDEILKMKRSGEDTSDLELELKLIGDKLKTGAFRMAEIYLDSLEKKVKGYEE